jgi:putative CocE/NonD family hydrolase
MSKPAVLFFGLAVAFQLAFSLTAGEAEEKASVRFTTEHDVFIELTDGTRLAADIYLPVSGGPFPTILIRTPYSKEQMIVFGEAFASSGYAVVIQDVRGKWSSEGDIIPFVNEQRDGLDTIDWIVGQAWCNGSLGMWGSSYLSYSSFVVAAAGPPNLKALFCISGWLNGDKVNGPGGALHWGLILPWMVHEATQEKRSLADFDMDELFKFIPLKDVMASIGIDDPVWSNPDTLDVMDHPYSGISVPIFHVTGWNDFVYPAALEIYEEVSAASPHFQKLLVGPWAHDQVWTSFTRAGDEDFGDRSIMGMEQVNQLAVRWFDHWLKGVDTGVTGEPPVKVFVMGSNDWREFPDWPPASASYRQLYLDGDGHANGLEGDGTLSAVQPRGESPHDSFVFDPMNPVPTTGGANFHFFPDGFGIMDQLEVESRADVLVYTSGPLLEPVEVIGPVTVELYASTDGKDTDFTAKLVEVREDGYARNIVEGIVRASMRTSLEEPEPLEPGRIYNLSIDLGATAIVIRKNSRLRLEVSSSNFPKYDRNPNTGEASWTATEYRKALQKVYHSREYPSRVTLSVLITEGRDLGSILGG